jgi:hypothetical protein
MVRGLGLSCSEFSRAWSSFSVERQTASGEGCALLRFIGEKAGCVCLKGFVSVLAVCVFFAVFCECWNRLQCVVDSADGCLQLLQSAGDDEGLVDCPAAAGQPVAGFVPEGSFFHEVVLD